MEAACVQEFAQIQLLRSELDDLLSQLAHKDQSLENQRQLINDLENKAKSANSDTVLLVRILSIIVLIKTRWYVGFFVCVQKHFLVALERSVKDMPAQAKSRTLIKATEFTSGVFLSAIAHILTELNQPVELLHNDMELVVVKGIEDVMRNIRNTIITLKEDHVELQDTVAYGTGNVQRKCADFGLN